MLEPLVIRFNPEFEVPSSVDNLITIDARIEVEWPSMPDSFKFAVEVKSQSTPLAIQSAINQIRKATGPSEYPMIMVPYLSSERLNDLTRDKISGVDMCGNGVVIIPGRLLLRIGGKPNLYPESRPLMNPYGGRSALVGRMLLEQPQWGTLKAMMSTMRKAGESISLSQISKALSAMVDDLIVFKQGRVFMLKEPLRLMDRLARSFERPTITKRMALRIPSKTALAEALSSEKQLKWAITGESSVVQYAPFSQGGPMGLAVTDATWAMNLLDGKPENVPSFADIELMEINEPGYYFQNKIDQSGMRWASRIQTWLELQTGDARQQDAAKELREQILTRIKI